MLQTKACVLYIGVFPSSPVEKEKKKKASRHHDKIFSTAHSIYIQVHTFSYISPSHSIIVDFIKFIFRLFEPNELDLIVRTSDDSKTHEHTKYVKHIVFESN